MVHPHPTWRQFTTARGLGVLACDGLAILARYSITCQQEQHPLSCREGVEVQAVILRLPRLELIINNIYRPPTADLELEMFHLSAIEMMLAPAILPPTTRGRTHRAPPMQQADNYTYL